MATIDRVLSALASPVRREAMRLLEAGDELCLCDFMKRLGIAQPNMSRHMSTLRAAGLVTDRRDAQWVRYRVNADLPSALSAVVETTLAAPDPEAATLGDRSAA
ncbi:MAG: transcriptional regulator [Hyphomicrobiales bacterium]|nr:MAG: transcriptional regulator [Hyphomicrobiales bacterium]